MAENPGPAGRLATITDRRGRTYLDQRYDDDGRVVERRYGTGVTTLSYQDAGAGMRTATGGVVVLRRDEDGHLVERTVDLL